MAPVDILARLKSLYSKHQGESIFLSFFGAAKFGQVS